MRILEETWRGIPLLHIVQESKKEESIPVVIFLHGFQSVNERNLQHAYHLARRGMRVLLPEAALHGSRSKQYGLEQMAAHFWEIVLQSIEEVGLLLDEIDTRYGDVNIGVAGTSMGGITTFGSLTKYERIDAAGSFMGSPAYVALAQGQLDYIRKKGIPLPIEEERIEQLLQLLEKYDLTKHTERLQDRPLFIWHGKMDDLVPYTLTASFVQTLNGDVVFRTDDEAGHKVPHKESVALAEWFARRIV